MSLQFVSQEIVGFHMEENACQASGSVLLRYHETDDPSYVESTCVRVACDFPKGEFRWKVKRRLKGAAQAKFELLEALYPEEITNIFVT